MHIRSAFVAFVFGPVLCAQTFVVDAANGPGSQFTTISAAIAAVPDGAVLDVRAGAYAENLVIQGKSLRILGQPGAHLVVPSAGQLSVQGLAATQQVVVRGFTVDVQSIFGAFGIVLGNNQGTVVLEDLVPFFLGYGSMTLAADSTATLLVRGCTFRGEFRLLDCTTVLERTTVSGGLGGTATHFVQTRGSLQLVDSTVRGPNNTVGAVLGAAVTLDQGDLRVLGASELQGGQSLFPPQGYAIAGIGTARLEPQVVLGGNTPRIEPTVTAVTVGMPRCTADSAALGNPSTGRLTGPAGAIAVLGVGIEAPATWVPGIQDPFCWLPGTAIAAAVGVLAPPTPLLATVAMPASPAWRGFVLTWQGVTYDPANGLLASNPAFAIVR